MKKLSLIFTLLTALFLQQVWSQTLTNAIVLRAIEADQERQLKEKKEQAIEFARNNNLPIRTETDSLVIEIQYIDALGNPQYFITTNAVSAESISTDEVYTGGSAGLDLDGNGIEVHQWDAGSVRSTHQEFDGRVTNGDAVGTSWHSTHVGGTIIASGVQTNAKGMAWAASLKAFDWNDFQAEIAAEAADGALISNHSYGWLRGWEGGNTWWGDPEISDQEDYLFGFYDESAATWDSIVYAAPYFLIVKSAGNDRDDKGDGTYPDDGPYDCIDQLGIAKNNLVVAAVYDVPGGYSQPSDVSMTGFSSWGPADDGRIKPDISGKGGDD